MNIIGCSRQLFWSFAALLLLSIAIILQPVPVQSQTTTIRPLELLLNPNQLVHLSAAPTPAPIALAHAATEAETTETNNPPDWSRIAFQSYRDGSWEIYMSAPDGLNLVRLTADDFTNVEPALARGGKQLAFITNRLKRNLLSLYIMNVDGSNLRALTNGEGNDHNPNWSPDGYTIAFESNRNNNTDLYRITADKTNLMQLTSAAGYDGQPSWSPDGSQLVFTSERSGAYALWLMNADGSNQRQLTFSAPALFPAWSPLGNTIAFAMDDSGDGFLELWQMDVNGANLHKVADNYAHGDAWHPSWSPDGKWLAYQITEWEKQGEQWFWRDSRLMLYDFISSPLEPILDTQIWQPSWTTLDVSAPGPCTPSSAAIQNSSSFVVGLSATDVGPAGVARYQAAKRQNANEAWQPIPEGAVSTSFLYEGQDGRTVEFRCRASDAAGNWAPWTEQPTTKVTVDITRPQSSVSVRESHVRGNQVQVQWLGHDPGGTLGSYDIWLRKGSGGLWQRWQDDVTTTSATLTGEVGNSYELRSQAVDKNGNLELWQPMAQATVLFYATALQTAVMDNRGNPAVPANYTLAPPAAQTTVITPATNLHFYLGSNPVHQLTVAGGGARTLPPARIATSTDTTFQWVFPAQDEQLHNGEFEADLTAGWAVNGTAVSRIATAHTGNYAVQLQRTTVGTAALRQQIFLSDTLYAPTLSWVQQLAAATTGFVVQLQSPLTATLLYQADSPAQANEVNGWEHQWVDLTPYQGQPVTITFALSNSVGQVWLDEISVGSWTTAGPLAVTPTTWPSQVAVNMIITGSHFISTPQVYLGNQQLDAVTLLSPTQLSVTVPAGFRQGTYDLVVMNPTGPSSRLAQAVSVRAEELFLPLVMRADTEESAANTADWPMLAQNVKRTAYNNHDAGGSQYTLVWQRQIPLAPSFLLRGMVTTGDTLVATFARSPSRLSTIALDVKTGKIRWQGRNHGGSAISAPTIAHSTLYYVADEYNNVTNLLAIDLATGQERWRYSLDTAQRTRDLAPLIIGNRVFISASSGGVAGGITAGAGAVLWSSSLNYYGMRAFAYANGLIYIGTQDGFYALEPTTGEATLLNPYSSFAIYSPPIVSGHNVTIGGRAVLDLTTNQLAWQDDYSDQGGMYMVDNRGILYRPRDGALQAIRVADGTVLWTVTVAEWLHYVFAGAGDYIYASTDTQTYIINRNTRQVVAEFAQGGIGIVANGYLYLASQDGQIFAYRAERP